MTGAFVHRVYRAGEPLDPVDAEMIRRGRARLKLRDDGCFIVVDNPDATGSMLAAELMRERIRAELAKRAKGGDRAQRGEAAARRWLELRAQGWRAAAARAQAAKETGVATETIRKAERRLRKAGEHMTDDDVARIAERLRNQKWGAE